MRTAPVKEVYTKNYVIRNGNNDLKDKLPKNSRNSKSDLKLHFTISYLDKKMHCIRRQTNPHLFPLMLLYFLIKSLMLSVAFLFLSFNIGKSLCLAVFNIVNFTEMPSFMKLYSHLSKQNKIYLHFLAR